MNAFRFNSRHRVMMIAPHPDDESLAAGILLQKIVRAAAVARVVYATDGDDNPWPQRLLERKWRLHASDRKRWGKLRRAEALAALHVLGIDADAARFLALPDQGLTDLLTGDCRSALERFAEIMKDWAPTHLLIPSISDTHPDHNALGVLLRMVLSENFSERDISILSYVVHGHSAAFFRHAQSLPATKTETAVKERAIRCHATQLKLSRKRFLAYAKRPEHFLDLVANPPAARDRFVRSILRREQTLHLALRTIRGTRSTLLLVGHDRAGAPRTVKIGLGKTRGRLVVPIENFSPARSIFVKLERSKIFFDAAGWIEIPATISEKKSAPAREFAAVVLAIR